MKITYRAEFTVKSDESPSKTHLASLSRKERKTAINQRIVHILEELEARGTFETPGDFRIDFGIQDDFYALYRL